MSIKILAGVLKGQKIQVYDSSALRPTSVLLRRKFFDSFQFEIIKYHFVDLCAGSGAMAIEAFSRGALSSKCIENNIKHYNILTSNLKKLKVIDDIKTYKIDCFKFLNQMNLSSDNNILYFDPPYENKSMYFQFITLINSIDFKGRVVLEACKKKTMPMEELITLCNKWQLFKIIENGDHYLLIFEID